MNTRRILSAILAIGLVVPSTTTKQTYAEDVESTAETTQDETAEITTTEISTTYQYNEELSKQLSSEYAYVYDIETKQVLFQKGDSEETIYPASLTKMMTAILAMESIDDLNQTITITQEMLDGLVEANASVVGYEVGQTPTVMDLLYGALLPSGADACNALVAITYGSEEAFVAAMNEKATELGMTGTHFVNTTGLHEDDHYSTTSDMAILTEYCLQNETFKEIFCAKTYTDTQGNYMYATVQPYLEWYDYNLPGFLGDKTGYTDEAGHCMSSYVELNGMKLVVVTAQAMTGMYSDEHLTDAEAILTWLEETYTRQTVLNEGELLSTYTAKEVIGSIDSEIYSTVPIEADIKNNSEITVSTDALDTYTVKNEEQTETVTISILMDGETILTEEQNFTVPKTDDFFNKILIFFRDLF